MDIGSSATVGSGTGLSYLLDLPQILQDGLQFGVDKLYSLAGGDINKVKEIRQQLKPKAYVRNGSIYAAKRNLILKKKRYGTLDQIYEERLEKKFLFLQKDQIMMFLLWLTKQGNLENI